MPGRILIVDDNEFFNDMLRCFLSTLGYEVEVSANATHGLKKSLQFQPDLIVVDIIMPDMDGFDFLRELNQKGNKAKVIAVSGGGLLDKYEYLRAAELLGADCAFSKPFQSLEVFGSKVKELMVA